MTMGPKNIFGWLGMKQEEEILKDAERHIEITYETVVNFKNAVKAYSDGDFIAKKGFVDKVRDCERQADAIKSKVEDFLSESPLVPPDREDLMRFIKNLDRIADWTNGSARLLSLLDEPLPREIMDNITISADLIFAAITKLKDAIHALLRNDFKQAIKDSYEVDALESKADDHRQTLVGIIIHAKLEAPRLLVTYQLAEYMEGVTDKIEDATDFLRILTMKAK